MANRESIEFNKFTVEILHNNPEQKMVEFRLKYQGQVMTIPYEWFDRVVDWWHHEVRGRKYRE